MKLDALYIAVPALALIDCVTAEPIKIPLRSIRRQPSKVAIARTRVRLRRQASPNIALTNWIEGVADFQWYANISVGTPPQNFTVLLDTGSNDLILPQSNCTTCGTHNLFDPASSSTFSAVPDLQIQFPFGTGSDAHPLSSPEIVTGVAVSDTVSIAGLPAANQPFLLCDTYSEDLRRVPMDGILGLPPVDISHLSSDTYTAPTFFWQLVASKQLDPVFSFRLGAGDSDVGEGGELTLGGIDQSQFQGNISYVGLNATGVALSAEWCVEQTAVFINDVAVSPNTSTGISVLDNGTGFIQTPDNATAAAIYAQISPDIRQIDPLGAWGAPCDVLSTLNPSITFTIGLGSQALNVTVDRESFNLGPYAGQNNTCQAVILNPVEPVSDLVTVWIIGSPLLKGYYTVWDGGNQQVGFAQLKNTTSGSKSTGGS